MWMINTQQKVSAESFTETRMDGGIGFRLDVILNSTSKFSMPVPGSLPVLIRRRAIPYKRLLNLTAGLVWYSPKRMIQPIRFPFGRLKKLRKGIATIPGGAFIRTKRPRKQLLKTPLPENRIMQTSSTSKRLKPLYGEMGKSFLFANSLRWQRRYWRSKRSGPLSSGIRKTRRRDHAICAGSQGPYESQNEGCL